MARGGGSGGGGGGGSGGSGGSGGGGGGGGGSTVGRVAGIDLGTTYSCLARVGASGRPEVVPTFDGSPTLPSVVLFVGPDDYITGEPARKLSRAQPDDVCSLVKRRMGEPGWKFVAHGRAWSAPAVSSLVLQALVADTALAAGEAVTAAVLTVPAYFGDEERRATVLAGKYAGLEVVDVIDEPTAAALSYGFARLDDVAADAGSHSTALEEVALVYDLGGGTFDVTVVELADRRLSVVAIDGDHELGGADWDEKIALHLARVFTGEHPDAEDPLDDSAGAQKLLLAAETAKRRLTETPTTQVRVVHDGEESTVTLTRAEFDQLTLGLLDRTLALTTAAVSAARQRGVRGIDRVLLVGGSSRMPAVAERLRTALRVPVELADPDLAVAKGAAVYAEKKEIERLVVADLVTRGQLVDGTPAENAEPGALDAACRRFADATGYALARVRRSVEVSVLNVVSRGFGIMAQDRFGDNSVVFLVHRNDRLPAVVRRSFGTVRDDQETVQIVIVEQGGGAESTRLDDNKLLATAEIAGIPPGHPEGTEIAIEFRMGFDGILEVTARHEGLAERPLTVRIETTAALSQADVAREREALAKLRRADL